MYRYETHYGLPMGRKKAKKDVSFFFFLSIQLAYKGTVDGQVVVNFTAMKIVHKSCKLHLGVRGFTTTIIPRVSSTWSPKPNR